MSTQEITEILESTGIQVSYQDFPDEECPPMPYITYEVTGNNDFCADGIPYLKVQQVTVSLYSCVPFPDEEKRLDDALEAAGISWKKTTEELEEEACQCITYSFEIIGG